MFLRNGLMEYGSSQTPGVSTPARILSANTHTQYNGPKQQANESSEVFGGRVTWESGVEHDEVVPGSHLSRCL